MHTPAARKTGVEFSASSPGGLTTIHSRRCIQQMEISFFKSPAQSLRGKEKGAVHRTALFCVQLSYLQFAP